MSNYSSSSNRAIFYQQLAPDLAPRVNDAADPDLARPLLYLKQKFKDFEAT